jgi:hypothetical protein
MQSILPWTGYLIEAVLLWRLLTWRAWRHFPVFFGYFVILLVRQAALAYVGARFGTTSPVYSEAFWYTDLFVVVLKFLVAWEVFRKAFRPGSAAQRFGATLLVVILVGLAVFYAVGGAYETHFFLAASLNFSFVVAVWIACVFALAQYYRFPMGRNVWGISLGLGLYAATAVVNLSALGLDPSAFPVASYVRPISFVLGVAIWTYCLWTYQPAPGPPPPASPSDSANSGEPWQATTGAVGRAMGLRAFWKIQTRRHPRFPASSTHCLE